MQPLGVLPWCPNRFGQCPLHPDPLLLRGEEGAKRAGLGQRCRTSEGNRIRNSEARSKSVLQKRKPPETRFRAVREIG